MRCLIKYSSILIILSIQDSIAQWFWQNPLPQGNGLNQVKYINESSGWAVGAGGVILKTTNGGNIWKMQSSGTVNTLTDIYILDENVVFIVGDAGTIIKTDNGGETWYNLTSGVDELLTAICFLDNNIGYAVGGHLLLKTTNGGGLWSNTTIDVDYINESVIFFNESNGLIASKWWGAPSGKIFKTTNGGSTWNETWVSDYLFDMTFVDNSTGYAVGGSFVATGIDNIMLKTTDGGNTWNTIIDGNGAAFWGVSFLDANNGFIVGTNGLIKKTTDGGENWSDISLAIDTGFTDIELIDDNKSVIVGEDGVIAISTNTGENWTIMNSSVTNMPVVSVHFCQDNIGYAIGSVWNGNIILKTTDGGNNWIPKTFEQQDIPLSDVYCIDENNIYAVGNSGALKTTNGGDNWEKINYSTNIGDVVGTKVYFLNNRIGFILNGYYIFKTTDSGDSWVSIMLDGLNSFNDFYFIDQNIGYTAGWSGSIAKTTDGGFGWLVQNSGTADDLFTIAFIDSSFGYVAGQNGTVLKTTNGGNNWEQVNNIDGKIVDMFFLDTNNGYALENQGIGGPKLLKTTDGAITWNLEQKAENKLLSVHFVNSNKGYIAGEKGTIIMYEGINQIPLAPNNLYTEQVGTNAVQLNWEDNSSNETAFVVYKFNNPIATLLADATNYIDTVYTTSELTYKVRAINGNGVSSFSNSSTVNITSVNNGSGTITTYKLLNNYPNPFNPITVIRYQLPVVSFVTLKVYDVLGKEVTTLVNEVKSTGTYDVTWNATDLTSGVYYYQLRSTPSGGQAREYIQTRKMLLLK